MFEGLSKRLGDVFDRLRGRGALSEADVDAALREVRTALLEADVALPVVRQFVDEVRPKAIGADVIRSVTPGQMVIKIVNDHLVEMLGGTVADLDLSAIPPVVILMVGLQGSGKTTSSAKIAYRLSQGPQGMAAEMFGGSGTFATKRKVMMASLDTRRPAAQQQLKVLGEQTGVPTLPIVPLEMPLAITRRALETARREGFDVLILDTAGRLAIDEELMTEVKQISDLAQPKETLLVADAMTGQDAVNVAKAFNERLAVTGIVLTRVDGDGRGGAALSMRSVTGKPIKLIGTGDITDDDILNGMGDVALGVVTSHHYSASHPSALNKKFVEAFSKANQGMRPNFMAVGGYDGMRVIYEAAKATKGAGGQALLDAMKGQIFESPRGPMFIDAQTRDVVHNIYIRKVEKVNGQLYNQEFATIKDVKDPGKSK